MDDHSDSELQCAGNMNAKRLSVDILPFIFLYCLGEVGVSGLFLYNGPMTLRGLNMCKHSLWFILLEYLTKKTLKNPNKP